MAEQFARQSFLGADSEDILAKLRVGVAGYGGGGSHIGQQLAHVGVGEIGVADPDIIEESNLNRLVGGTSYDVTAETPKIRIASRTIGAIHPHTTVRTFQSAWTEAAEYFRSVHVLLGAVDTFAERIQLERFARRFMIPYIDIGMDVVERDEGYGIIGQVILSSPGTPCLRCLGLVTDEMLAEEERARQYGAAGSKPQVVWPNGVLASTAVGLLTQLVTPWHPNLVSSAYLEYDGNRNTLRPAPRLEAIQRHGLKCKHFRNEDVGDAFYGSPLF
jgi:molybdopterin-synthase adenylyltransferase